MNSVNFIFPHQLFEDSPLHENGFPVYLVEEFLFFGQYKFHKQKIAFHRASMKCYESYLHSKGIAVYYIEAKEANADIRNLIAYLGNQNVDIIYFIDPADNWLQKRIVSSAAKAAIKLIQYETKLFINSKKELAAYFNLSKEKFFQTDFYISQRKKRKILVDKNDKPVGGKWSFDAENRKKYPAKKQAPNVSYPEINHFYEEAKIYAESNYNNNPGNVTAYPLQPFDFASTRKWFRDFLAYRFADFGPYEDAIVKNENILHHSKLTPMLNAGLISPQEIIDETMLYATEQKIPLNSAEGFLRQVIGWREFIHGVYEAKGTEQRNKNYWGFSRKIPASFYEATTGIEPVDATIKKVLHAGWCHHIERLMVLGNFMLLCEFDPDEVYKWFMELFIDAYDWVMVPNVYGMSQFADGGLMSTKPYISGSNYIMKMSDYKKGPWQKTWDALFWRFMHVHRDFFEQNPRIGMLVKSFDKMPAEKQKELIEVANNFLNKLE
ncbi:MAG: cryptochrome/photolyase family protein [Ginsengibacter sp.]